MEQPKRARDGSCEVSFGGEVRSMRLTLTMWEKVQEACDAGPPEILAALAPLMVVPEGIPAIQFAAGGGFGRWRIQYVRAPILYGLIGAGMEPSVAHKLVVDWVDQRPLLEAAPVALAVVMVSILPPEDEPVGESGGEGEATPPPPKKSSASRPSSATNSASA